MRWIQNLRKQAFILIWLCFGAAGCRSRHAGPNAGLPEGNGQKADLRADLAADSAAVGMDLDTSMLSLKNASKISLTDLMSQVWKLEDADPAHWNDVFWDSSADARIYPELALFKDHELTENARCNIKMGRWQLNKANRELTLRFANGASKTYIVGQFAMKHMELTWKRPEDSVDIKLSAEAIVHKRPADDPFYPANNRWRIRPGAPETAEELRERVKGCVHFFSLFFLDNHLRQETDIIFTGLPSCFVWYNGGIGMQDKLNVDKTWTACFYSGTDAMKGYELVESILASHTLKWPEHPTSWVEQTGEVLQQIADKL